MPVSGQSRRVPPLRTGTEKKLAPGPEGVSCAMTPEIAKLDEMWHTFVLFTRDYADFCERYFGFFLHHIPNEDEEERSEDPETVRAHLEQYFGLVYDVLGEETLQRWYEEGRYAA